MTKYHVLLANVDELWLKGGNRRIYLNLLKQNIRHSLEVTQGKNFQLEQEGPKFVLTSEGGFSEDSIARLQKLPGVHSVDLARKVAKDYEAIFPAVVEELESLEVFPKTMKVLAKRSDKNFPMNSMDLSRRIGGEVLKKYDGKIHAQMNHPEVMIHIRVLQNDIFIYTRRLPGAGGLPVGMTGRVLSLLSGGFDSPVASWMMARRGCDLSYVFFHAYPFVGDEVKEKIIELAKVLRPSVRSSPLFIVPFGKIQSVIAKTARMPYRTLLFRKTMIELSTQLAKQIRAKGLVTGDALAQVSSQTLENIALLDRCSDLPIFRPLIGMHKIEIIDWARRIGTHDLSTIPHDDACGLFAPKHPVIKGSRVYTEKWSQGHPMEELFAEALAETELLFIQPDGEVVRQTLAESKFAKKAPAVPPTSTSIEAPKFLN